MRIEILGPSGVGKSTVLNSVQSLWADRIIFPDKIALIAKTTERKEIRKITNLFFDKNKQLNDYITYVLNTISQTNMTFDQKFYVIERAKTSLIEHALSELASRGDDFVIHDELLLHRGFSFLHFCENFDESAKVYYETVPTPDIAIVFKAQPSTIIDRVRHRGIDMNCYRGLHGEKFRLAILKSLAICAIAAEALLKRGVNVRTIDASGEIKDSSAQLNDILSEFFFERKEPPTSSDRVKSLKNRSIESSRSFRKKSGRHYIKSNDVIYCAFTTPNFTVYRHEAQRDASMRFEKFGLNRNTLQGKRVLDFGSNIGAMLFQATNFSIAEGVGVEYDYDKVKIAQEIASLSQLDNLSFRQGDIDALNADELGDFDITFALAVEGHIQNPAKFYKLLGAITKETLYFEGNQGCDIENVKNILNNVGFKHVEYLGFCNDDIVPTNNRRPLLRAIK